MFTHWRVHCLWLELDSVLILDGELLLLMLKGQLLLLLLLLVKCLLMYFSHDDDDVPLWEEGWSIK